MIYDTIIVGGGPAGMSAAIYAARFRLSTLILAGRIGGLVQDTHVIENYPGIKSVSGGELAKMFVEHAKEYKVPIKEEFVREIIKSGKYFKVASDKAKYIARTVICATGTQHRKLAVPGEEELQNKGVSYCAICDGPLFRNKVVGVVGGSDSAAKEALFLTKYAKHVYIIYRKEKIRAEPINTERIAKNKKITIINNALVNSIHGQKFLEFVTLDREYKGSNQLKLDGLFIEAGLVPRGQLASQAGVSVNERGEVIINRNSETNLPGFFAAGDCTDSAWKQVITGAAEGSMAALSAYQFLKK